MNPEPSIRRHVVVRFAPAVARRVAVMLWHPTQQTVFDTDGSLTFTATVDDLDEIADWILSFGPRAEVVEPAALREEIRRRAAEVAAMYRADAE